MHSKPNFPFFPFVGLFAIIAVVVTLIDNYKIQSNLNESASITKELILEKSQLNSVNTLDYYNKNKRTVPYTNYKFILYGNIENNKYKHFVVLDSSTDNINQVLTQDLKLPETLILQYFTLVSKNKTIFCLKSILDNSRQVLIKFNNQPDGDGHFKCLYPLEKSIIPIDITELPLTL